MARHAAWIAFGVYVVLAWVLPPTHPVLAWSMYASSGQREDASVLSFRADGEPVEIFALTDFRGEGLRTFGPPPEAGETQGWPLARWRRWIQTHDAPADAPPGPVRVEVGWVHLVATPDGPVQDGDFRVIASGTARWVDP